MFRVWILGLKMSNDGGSRAQDTVGWEHDAENLTLGFYPSYVYILFLEVSPLYPLLSSLIIV